MPTKREPLDNEVDLLSGELLGCLHNNLMSAQECGNREYIVRRGILVRARRECGKAESAVPVPVARSIVMRPTILDWVGGA
jgi:hypothetical protein